MNRSRVVVSPGKPLHAQSPDRSDPRPPVVQSSPTQFAMACYFPAPYSKLLHSYLAIHRSCHRPFALGVTNSLRANNIPGPSVKLFPTHATLRQFHKHNSHPSGRTTNHPSSDPRSKIQLLFAQPDVLLASQIDPSIPALARSR